MQGQHIEFERLIAYVEGRVDAEERAAIELHLEHCARCADDSAWLRRFAPSIGLRALEPPPPAARERVRALFRAWRKPPARTTRALLRFDSSAISGALGRRSGATAERQLIFAAASFDLDLRIGHQNDQWVIAGQVLGPETAGYVEVAAPQHSERVALSDSCEFTLPPLDDGHYTLFLRLGDLEVRIDDLALPAE
jgi:anti-sigma factor RsiW